jgi:hypothetical protein
MSRKGSALINFFLNFSTYAINWIEKVNVKFTPDLFNVAVTGIFFKTNLFLNLNVNNVESR